jgi:transcriptional regulator with XRE-family HTH domain
MHHFDGTSARRRREALGLRREEVAVRLRRSAESIAAYESGKVDPPASIVAQLADALSCDPGVLFTVEPLVGAA